MTELQWGRYNQLKREYKDKLDIAEKEYYNSRNKSLTSSRNTKSWWKVVNDVLGRSKNDTYPPLLNQANNTYVSDNEEKADLFNAFFLSHNRVDSSNTDLPAYVADMDIPILSEIVASEQEVYDFIQILDPGKATGPDLISPRLLKIAGRTIVPSLTKLINISLQQKIVPDMWKSANVIPLHKKSDKSVLNNYRPVSILPAPSKILERIVFKRLYNFCT